MLSKLRALERIPLTPEGTTVAEAIRALDTAISDNLPLLVFSFHSPSLCAGHVPYVRTEEELKKFYQWWDTVIAYLGERSIAPIGLSDLIRVVQGTAASWRHNGDGVPLT
jgi:hypothetical protein